MKSCLYVHTNIHIVEMDMLIFLNGQLLVIDNAIAWNLFAGFTCFARSCFLSLTQTMKRGKGLLSLGNTEGKFYFEAPALTFGITMGVALLAHDAACDTHTNTNWDEIHSRIFCIVFTSIPPQYRALLLFPLCFLVFYCSFRFRCLR